MITRLPNLSSTGSQPMWQAEGGPHALLERYPHPSIHRGDFGRHSLPPIPSFKSKVSAYISRLPMASQADPHEIVHEPFDAPRRRNVTRKGEMEKVFLPGSMEAACSNYRSDFTLKEAERGCSFKPSEEPVASGLPFSAVSLYRKEFPAHDASAFKGIPSAGGFNQQARRERRQCLKTVYTAPELPFHADTTYGLAFRSGAEGQRGGTRHAGLATGDQVMISGPGPFEGRSVYRSEFVPKSGEAPQVLQNLSALSYNCDRRPPSRVQRFVEHADHVFYQP